MPWGGHLDLHVSGNRRRNHWLLVLMLVVAMTLLGRLVLLEVLLLLWMRRDLRVGRSARHCHGHGRRLWRHWVLLLQFLAWLDFRFRHG